VIFNRNIAKTDQRLFFQIDQLASRLLKTGMVIKVLKLRSMNKTKQNLWKFIDKTLEKS
jgi:hypothetical protein